CSRAKPRRHLHGMSGAGVEQDAPALHLDRRERLLAEPVDDRRGSAEERRETPDSLELLDGGGDEPRVRPATGGTRLEAGACRPERFAAFHPPRSQIADQAV